MLAPTLASIEAVVAAEWREESVARDLEAQSDAEEAGDKAHAQAQVQSLKLSIHGMTCASCVATIQNHLKATFPDWLLACDINLLTESGQVSFDAAHPASSAQKIIAEIEDVGFGATVVDDGRSDGLAQGHAAAGAATSAPKSGAEKAASMVAARQASVRHYRQLLLFCLVFAVPVFLLGMVLDYIPVTSAGLMRRVYRSLSLGSLLMWILSSPVQFGVGAIFYRLAWKGLRHRNANMSLLIAIGTTAAYGYALIDVIRALATPMEMGAMPTAAAEHGGHGSDGTGASTPPTDSAASMEEHGSGIGGMGGAMFFETASTLITFVILGRFLEALAKGKTSEALVKLTQMQADVAILLHLDPVTGAVASEEEVASSSLQVGQLVKVLRGTKVPADGVVTEGSSAVDEAFLTGESLPVHKQPGDEVIGASINQESTLIVRVTRAASESTLANILHLMENAQSGKAPIQKFADRLSGVFVPIVVVLAFVTWLIWFLIATQSSLIPEDWFTQDGANGSRFLFSFLFGLAVVVIACPCALGLATPTAVMVGTGVGATLGVLIKGGAALETAHKVTSFVFDKTGTLTEGKPKVTAVQQFPASAAGLTLARLAFLLGSAEQNSEHVLAKAIVAWAKEAAANDSLAQPVDFVATSGKGLTCVVDGSKVAVGNRACMSDASVRIPPEADEYMVAAERSGAIALAVAIDGIFAAVLSLSDPPKLEARSIVLHLTHRMGIDVWMCTGDNVRTAHTVAARVGIPPERVVASALPADKLELVKRLQATGQSVGMIGDGINDSPALAQANLGVSVGAGTDVAMETASVVLVRNDLRDLVTALDLSRSTLRRIRINFVWALGYNLIGIPIAAGLFYPAVQIRLPPELAALAMALSSVSVICSSLWLKRYRKPVIREEALTSAPTASSSECAEVELSSIHGGEQEQPLTGDGTCVDPQFTPSPSALQASVFGRDGHGAFCDCGCQCRRRSKGDHAVHNSAHAVIARSCCQPSSNAPAAASLVHAVRFHVEKDMGEDDHAELNIYPAPPHSSAPRAIGTGCTCQCGSCKCKLSTQRV